MNKKLKSFLIESFAIVFCLVGLIIWEGFRGSLIRIFGIGFIVFGIYLFQYYQKI